MNMTWSIGGLRWADAYDDWLRPVEASAERAQELCRQALEITDRLDAELWISSILGEWWSQTAGQPPWELPEEPEPDLDFVVAGPAIRQIAALGGPGAWAVLHGVWTLHAGRAGRLAGDLADTFDTVSFDPPSWTSDLGARSAVRELIQRRPNGAELIAIELRHVLEEPRWLVVFSSPSSYCKRINVCLGFDEVEEFAKAVARKNAKVLPFVDLPTGHGCARAHQAIEDTSGRADGRFAELRAWALAMTRWPPVDVARRRHTDSFDRRTRGGRGWDPAGY